MKIRTILLTTFLPLVLIPLLIAGGLVVWGMKYVSDDTDNITESVVKLQGTAIESSIKAVARAKEFVEADYQVLLNQLCKELELNKHYLSINLRTTAHSAGAFVLPET